MAEKHKYSFREMSDVKCANPNCRKPLKRNVVERKPEGSLIFCWACWVKKTRHMTLAAYKKYRTKRVKAINEGGDPQAVLQANM